MSTKYYSCNAQESVNTSEGEEGEGKRQRYREIESKKERHI